ncbi:MAG: cytochrome c [Paracoccaceae bacterium]|nr:cytochrome c [Paracoccaceae bacterium]
MKRLLWPVLIVIVLGLAVYGSLTRPALLDETSFSEQTGNADRGKTVFDASGCASCHAAENADEESHLILTGGKRFDSPFGTFIAPNLSSDVEMGIGGWTDYEIANAVINGVGPQKQHYFPAFPYATYNKMTRADLADLVSYLRELPASDVKSQPHEVSFPFNIRRNLGGWKFLFSSDDWVMQGDLSDELIRGRYLVEALGHCGECHTPRNALGGMKSGKWLGGAAHPSGKGRIPNITPAALEWAKGDIVEYLTSGFTPEFDTAGGEMVEVVENMARLSQSDREAIAAYLLALPSVE